MDTPLLRIRRNGCKRMYDGREVQWFVGSKALSLVLECELLRRNPLSELIQRFRRHIGARCLAKSHVLRKILEHFRLLLLNHDNFVERCLVHLERRCEWRVGQPRPLVGRFRGRIRAGALSEQAHHLCSAYVCGYSSGYRALGT